MNINASAHTEATDVIRFTDRSDLDVTILYTGREYEGDGFHIRGTPAERVDFLRRLAEQAADAAYRLAVETEQAEKTAVTS